MAMRIPSLTVRGLRARAVDVPMSPPLQTASGTIDTAPLVLIDLLTAEGVTGCSYVFCYTPVALRPTARLAAEVAEVIAGKTAAPAAIAHTLQQHFRLLGPQGLTGLVIGGIDVAAWDALGKAAGLPLVRLLGGECVSVPAYASLRSMASSDAANEAATIVAAGVRAVKVRIGHPNVRQDLLVVQTLRKSVGGAVALMVDYNQCLSVAEAIRRAAVLDGEDIGWIEEPVRADDYLGHAAVARAARTPIQLGENWWGPPDMAKSVAAESSDCAMVDVTKIWGVTGWLRAAALAEAAGLPVSSHLFPEVSAHLLAVTPTRDRLEYLDLAGPILSTPLVLEDGRATASSRPGIGVEWNEEAVRRYLVDEWSRAPR
jgi:mandelate racemase